MNFIGFTLITLITFIIMTFSFSQIIGILVIKLPQKQYNCIVGLIMWVIITIIYYYVIYNYFKVYLTLCIIVSILALITVFSNMKNMKNE